MVNWSNIGLCSTMDGKSVEWLKTWGQAVEKVKAAGIRDSEKGMYYPQPSQSQAVGVGMGNPGKGIDYPHRSFPQIVTESTFESYDKIGKNEVIDLMKAAGIDFRALSPRNTAIKRYEMGHTGVNTTNAFALSTLNQKAKEEIDVKAMWKLVEEGKVHLRKPTKVIIDFADPRICFEAHRRHNQLDICPVVQKTALPDPSTMGEAFKLMWCNTAKMKLVKPKYVYDWNIVGPILLAYLDSNGGRKDFERLVGCYNAGYPSYARATWYRRIFGTQVARAKARKDGTTLPPRLRPSDARRVTRELRHLFVISGVGRPDSGIEYPAKGI